jgi:frataxin-like iron-binding protein CyaY
MTIIEKAKKNFNTDELFYNDGVLVRTTVSKDDPNEMLFGYSREESAVCCGVATIGNIVITSNVAIYDHELLIDLLENMLDIELLHKSQIVVTVALGQIRHMYLSKLLTGRGAPKYNFISNSWVNRNTGNDLLTYLITKKTK